VRSQAARLCDQHGSWLAGENPVMALGRREHVGEGKRPCASHGGGEVKEETARVPMRDLKEARVQTRHPCECEPL
jgi:hypothetical protein